MSYIGLNPTVNFLNLKPLSADPTNPQEGDIYFSDGTARLEGPWVYQNAQWNQFSTGAAITTVNNLTLTPQSADPGSPDQGMLFYSDGTSRAEGIWVYNGTGWVQVTGVKYQEFFLKSAIAARVSTTGNVLIASQLEQGDTVNGITLVAGDIVLVRAQTTSSENGVYVVPVSGAATRHPSYDTASELTRAVVWVEFGSSGSRSYYFQNNTLSSLSDAQSWATTPASFSFSVPQGVHEIEIEGIGAGGGGGGGGGSVQASVGGSGGGGGAGAIPDTLSIKVSPAETLIIDVGVAGLGGTGGGSGVNDFGQTGLSGGNSTVTLFGRAIRFYGASGGTGGRGTSESGSVGAGGSTLNLGSTTSSAQVASRGGNGGLGSGSGSTSATGSSGGFSSYVPLLQSAGGVGGFSRVGGGGGGGGPGYGPGSDGIAGFSQVNNVVRPVFEDPPYGAGGGGGGGAGANAGTGAGGVGRNGGHGYIRISWK